MRRTLLVLILGAWWAALAVGCSPAAPEAAPLTSGTNGAAVTTSPSPDAGGPAAGPSSPEDKDAALLHLPPQAPLPADPGCPAGYAPAINDANQCCPSGEPFFHDDGLCHDSPPDVSPMPRDHIVPPRAE